MFLAYNAVHYSLYPAYELYALLEPGTPEAAYQANNLLGKDEQVAEFNNTLRKISWDGRDLLYQDSWHVTVVRSSNGVTFDLYFKNDDYQFLASAVEVPADQVIEEGSKLMAGWREYQPVPFRPSKDDPRFSKE